MKKLISILTIFLAALLAAAVIASAYGGTVSPLRSTAPALLAMTFPFCALAALIGAVLCLFFSKISSAILAASLLISAPSIRSYFPIHIVSSDDGRCRISVMTYNVCNLTNFSNPADTATANPTLSFIMRQRPDIAALQECATFATSTSAPVAPALLDSLYAAYPYRSNGPEGNAILSKFPFREIPLHYRPHHNFQVRAYTIFAPSDTFTLFNLHLKSIGLNSQDKELYRDITKGKTEGTPLRSELREIRHSLVSKLSAAFRERAEQSAKVKELIDSIGGPVIVCGDFNDVPGCHAIRTICSAGLEDAYADAATGYTITYHADRFLFRIDHILYRGFTPTGVSRPTPPFSDHYPLIATFAPSDI